MAVKQEIKYKVRKIDGTDGAEGKIVLNSVKEGARYLVHRAVVAQSNKKTRYSLYKNRSEVSGEENLGNKKEQVMQELDLVTHHYGLEEELHLVLNQDHMHRKSM